MTLPLPESAQRLAAGRRCRSLLLGAALLFGQPLLAQPAADDGAPAPTFDVWEYQVSGNTVLESRDIELAVYPHLGPGRTIDDVEQARSALEGAYRERGLGTVLVDIPEQDVVGGVVRLEVVEGRVERLRVSGSRYFSLGRIKSKVPALAEGSLPNLPEVQKQLAELNRMSPDRSITPVLKPGRRPGGVEVELSVEDQLPLHGSVSLNDRFSPFTSRTRLNATISYDNLWQKEHSASFSYQVAPENREDVEVFSGTYLARLPDSDKLLVLYAVNSNSDVATLGTLGVVGVGNIVGVRGIIPLPSRPDYVHSLLLGADYKDFDESVSLLDADTLETPISYLVWSAQYNATLNQEEATNRFSIGTTFGMRGLGNTVKEFAIKRFQGRPNFVFLTARAERTQEFYWGSQLFARLTGQVANSPIITNEQFNVGGVDTVRGYLQSQRLADDGVYTNLEWRSPSFANKLGDVFTNARVYGFADAAYLRTQDPLPGQDALARLYSVGLGMRVDLIKGFYTRLDWAYPLTGSSPIRAGEARLHFDLGWNY